MNAASSLLVGLAIFVMMGGISYFIVVETKKDDLNITKGFLMIGGFLFAGIFLMTIAYFVS